MQDIVDILLVAGYEISSELLFTSLFVIKSELRYEIMEELIGRNFDFNFEENKDEKVLIDAIMNGNPYTVGDFNRSILQYSIINNDVEMVRMALKAGANPYLCQVFIRIPPIELARKLKFYDIVDLLSTVCKVKIRPRMYLRAFNDLMRYV